MPFQPGNQLGRFNKPKPFRDALEMEVALAAQGQSTPAHHGSLRHIARAMLNRASNGDVAATTFIVERLDGKIPQALIGDNEHDPITIRAIAWLEPQQTEQNQPETIEANASSSQSEYAQIETTPQEEEPASETMVRPTKPQSSALLHPQERCEPRQTSLEEHQSPVGRDAIPPQRHAETAQPCENSIHGMSSNGQARAEAKAAKQHARDMLLKDESNQ